MQVERLIEANKGVRIVTICVSLFGFELIDLKVCQVLLHGTCIIFKV